MMANDGYSQHPANARQHASTVPWTGGRAVRSSPSLSSDRNTGTTMSLSRAQARRRPHLAPPVTGRPCLRRLLLTAGETPDTTPFTGPALHSTADAPITSPCRWPPGFYLRLQWPVWAPEHTAWNPPEQSPSMLRNMADELHSKMSLNLLF